MHLVGLRLTASGSWRMSSRLKAISKPILSVKLHEPDQAIAKFKEGITLKEDSLGRSGLGGAYFGRGRFEEAIKEYEKAIVLENDKSSQASYHMMIGMAFYRLERYEDAIEKLQEATKLDENNALLYDLLASAYEGLASKYLAKQDYQRKAFNLLTKAGAVRKLPSTNPLPYYALGTTYGIRFIQKGDELDFEKAVMWLGKASAISPNSPLPYQGLGLIDLRRLKADEALANLEKAIEYGPKDPSNDVALGQVDFQLKGNSRAAVGQYKKAIEISPTMRMLIYSWVLSITTTGILQKLPSRRWKRLSTIPNTCRLIWSSQRSFRFQELRRSRQPPEQAFGIGAHGI